MSYPSGEDGYDGYGVQADEFAEPMGTGMRRVPAGAGAEFTPEQAEGLLARLDEFDAVRIRGEAESRSAYLHGRQR